MKGFVGALRSFFTLGVFLGTFTGADDDALMRVTFFAVATLPSYFLVADYLPIKIACYCRLSRSV